MINNSDANEMRRFENYENADNSRLMDFKLVMENSSNTTLKRDGFTFNWRIVNFSCFGRKPGEYIQSPTFLVEKLDKTEWYLRLYPRGDVDAEFIACYLYRKKTDGGPDKIVIGYNISFVTVDGSPNISGQVEKLVFAKNKGYGNTKFKKRDDLYRRKKAYLPKDTLTVRCHIWKCFFEKSIVKECFACTRLDVEKCFLAWSIKNFSACESNVKQKIPFVPASNKIPPMDIKWYINGDNGNVHIELIQHNKKNLTANFVNCIISLVDAKGNNEVLIQKDHHFETFKDDQTWRLPPLFKKEKILTNKELYLVDDTLSLSCKLAISTGEEFSTIAETSFAPNQNFEKDAMKLSTLKEDFVSLLKNKKFCDLTLRTTTKSFSVHKAILSSRSPVFCNLLDNAEVEENKNIINVYDVDEITLGDMLIYMYSDTLEDLHLESAIKLYCAADKFQVLSLKYVCSHYLKSILHVSNACLVLALADDHKDEDMKKFVQEFICKNANEIFLSKQWKDFTEKKVVLGSETMHKAWKEI